MSSLVSILFTLLIGTSLIGKDFCRNWSFWTDSNPVCETVDLPHDAMLRSGREADSPSGSGGAFFLPDIYHYEKKMDVPKEWLDKDVRLRFEGVYQNAKVFVNDRLAGGAPYGYIPFEVNLNGLLKEGANTIRIDADNSRMPNSRWYSGGGIYRPVHLLVRNRDPLEGVRIKTVATDPPAIAVDVTHGRGEVLVDILDNGRVIASWKGDGTHRLPGAQLWSDKSPYLYTARVRLMRGKKELDRTDVTFGIRMLSWDATGFYVNGKNTLLRGGCIHHDNGVLGAAEYDMAAVRRISRLKSFGFNAIRSAHNPVSEAVLRACDSLGVFVMDELWDMWYTPKNPYDYSNAFEENYLSDLEATVQKDFNHPSVILYSIGNELTEPTGEKGLALADEIIGEIHRLDPTRGVTAGLNLLIMSMSSSGGQNTGSLGDASSGPMSSTQYNEMMSRIGEAMSGSLIQTERVDSVISPMMDRLDISGYNYGRGRYESDTALHPARVTVGTETFTFNVARNWKIVQNIPSLIGDFMWTAWDYMGENGIGAWSYEDDAQAFAKPYPWLLADTGAFDILGWPTAPAFLAKAAWEDEPGNPYITVRPLREGTLIKAPWRGSDGIPSWSWWESEGREAVVEVFTGASEVALFLNGEKMGETTVSDKTATFRVPYTPGVLEAVAVKDGHVCGTSRLESAEGGVHIQITFETDSFSSGDVVYADIRLVGDNGIVWSNRDCDLQVHAEGAELLGFGSACPRTEASFLDGCYPSWHGYAQAILKVQDTDTVSLTVSADSLQTKTLTLKSK